MWKVNMAAFILSVFLCAAVALASHSSETTWNQIAIGGGGYVLQTFFHPDGHAYMKTDVGGAYRRTSAPAAPGGYAWIPLLDWAGPDQGGFYSVSAIAMGPTDGAQLFLLAGAYWAWSNCTALISTDAGDSWEVAPASKGWGMKCGGNENDRAVGDRMSVHPTTAGLVAVGGSDGAVYITVDGFASTVPVRVQLPSPASTTPCDPDKNNTCVVRSVAWLPTSAGTLLIAAVPALGFFASAGPDYTDATTWAFVTGSGGDATMPSDINRIALPGTPGKLWVTCGRGGVWSGTVTGSSGAWQVTWDVAGALADQDVPFSGIAVRNSGADVMVMSMMYDTNTTFFRSLDMGATFQQLNWTCRSSVPWWGNGDFNTGLNAASSLSYDPATTSIWTTDFFGAYVADAPSNATFLSFQNVETGHEEVCMNTIRDPAVGNLLSGAADVGGWLHDQGSQAWPTSTFKAHDGWAHNCLFNIDLTLSLAPGNATADTVWVTAGDEYGACHGNPSWCGLHSWVGVSRDGGKTFADSNWDNIYAVDQANPYRVAVHPFDGSKAVVAARSGLPVTYTRDYGQTWANSSGGVSSVGLQGNFWFALPLATEKQIDETSPEATVYYYNGTTTLFTSVDSGATFTPTYTNFPTWNVPYFAVATPPRGTAAAGDIWAFAGWQLHHSTNGGANFSGVYQFYHPSTTITIGALPSVTSPSGRDAGTLASLCAAQGAAKGESLGYAPLPVQPPTRSGAPAAYAVYAIGIRNYDEPTALFGSVDFGHSWIPLSGANATADQGLGDSPLVLEASAKEPGLLYVGTGGRGAFFRNVTGDLVAALLACEN